MNGVWAPVCVKISLVCEFDREIDTHDHDISISRERDVWLCLTVYLTMCRELVHHIES